MAARIYVFHNLTSARPLATSRTPDVTVLVLKTHGRLVYLKINKYDTRHSTANFTHVQRCILLETSRRGPIEREHISIVRFLV